MATDTRSYINYTSGDASFRVWGSSWSASMQAAGLTKTSDTGQIDWATVLRPAAWNMAGYEIFRLTTDSQHSTFPLYIKIEYGAASFAYHPSWTFQTGSTTSGAGVLGGQLSTKRTFNPSATATTTAYPTYSSGGDGYFCTVAHWRPGTATTDGRNSIIVIERLRDNSGSTTANGVYSFVAGDTGTSGIQEGWSQIVRSSGLASNIITGRFGCFMQDQSGNFASDFYLNTHHPADRQIYNPCLSNLFYYYSDITALTDLTVSMYGANHTYKLLGRNHTAGGSPYITNFGHTNSGFAILWE